MKKIEQVSFGSVGVKIFTAFAAFIKALVIGFALIVIGLISIVFKYLALLMIVCSVILLFIAMIPGYEQVLGNAGKKLMQFALLGGLGLFFVRAFLFVNGLIEGAAGGMNKIYFWSAIIQGLIWFVLYRCRHLLGGLFVKGTISAQELLRKLNLTLTVFLCQNFPQRQKATDLIRLCDKLTFPLITFLFHLLSQVSKIP